MKKVIPTGKLKRTGVAALAAAKIGVRQLGHLTKRPFLSNAAKEQQTSDIDEANANILFQALVQLRGTALKVAQMLSMESDILPEKYRKELAKSYYQVPPLNRALMRKVIIQELGQAPEQVFKEIESKAFAAASLGQVHQATSFQGERLAVKVQYPGIEHTISSDIRMVKQLTRPMKEHAEIKIVLEEIEARLVEETDYTKEATNINWFTAHLDMEQVIIPKVYPVQSSKCVLTMQYIDGLHLTEWLKTKPSQQRRDKAAQAIYDIFMRSVFELRRFHADPNIGNYLFQESGKVVLLDFGCVKQISPVFAQQYAELFKSVAAADYDALFSLYQDIGVLQVATNAIPKSYYDEALIPFFEWFAKPYQHEYFDFSENQGFSSQLLKFAEAMHKHNDMNHDHVRVNKDFIYADRTLYGLYKIFEMLGAKVRMQNQWTSD
ncbi:MAG: AarF/ABC1/UbiB kinase family protein [Ghiorsea sp.]|nr:AarF/ABC1/UbiB kinase family protein [Ghiorsea sp.]